MQQIKLSVTSREQTGTGPNYRLRAEGKIPAIIYGAGGDVQKVALDTREFQKMLKGADAENSIFQISADGGAEQNAIIREIQRDPVTRRILHVDLYRIRMDVENTFEVAVHGVGTPVGVREGGLLETHLREIEIRCLPANLPSAINIELAGLKVNSSIHVRDIPAPEGVTITTDPDQVIFTVLPPRAESTSATAEGAEAAQPEVIGKKKAEEGDEKKK